MAVFSRSSGKREEVLLPAEEVEQEVMVPAEQVAKVVQEEEGEVGTYMCLIAGIRQTTGV